MYDFDTLVYQMCPVKYQYEHFGNILVMIGTSITIARYFLPYIIPMLKLDLIQIIPVDDMR